MQIPFNPQIHNSTFEIKNSEVRPINPSLEEIEFAGLIAEAEKIKEKSSHENSQ